MTSLVNIPSHNFYYEADAEHNPDKKVRWTDVYLDPVRQWLNNISYMPSL